MREFSNRISESWAIVRRKDTQNDKIAMFIHGFMGNYLSTWGKLPDMLDKFADDDEIYSSWDFVFIGYDTKKINSYLDIAALLWTEWQKAFNGERPYTTRYNKLALFGHSLGTLGIRQALCAWSRQPTKMLESIHGITLFGTPLNGSPLALFAFGYPIAEALKPKNPQLRMLKTWTDCAYSKEPWPEVSVILGQDDQVVGDKYAELIKWVGDGNPMVTTLDHSDLVKPIYWNKSSLVDYIATALR